jgi:serine/threonine-protein kinase
MKYLPSQNIIHPDLKPANLLIHEKGKIRIADLGIAKLEDCGATPEVIGTLPYMSPKDKPCPLTIRGSLFHSSVTYPSRM